VIKGLKQYWPTIRPIINTANYFANRYHKKIWLIGDGRSGTTWVSSLINVNRRYRELFEPFNPKFNPQYANLMQPNQYLRPDSNNTEILSLATNIFTGKININKVDEANNSLFYDGLLIKDIFSNLFVKWAINHFPELKVVFLIRNPFDVALSKQNLKHWNWLIDPTNFLTQQTLMDDYLSPYYDLIASIEDDFILKQILTWSILHYVPFKMIEPNDAYPVFYEELVNDPVFQVKQLRMQLGINSDGIEDKLHKAITKTSRTQRTSRASDNPGYWKNEIPGKTIDASFRILEEFNLLHLYDFNTSMPVHSHFRAIYGKH